MYFNDDEQRVSELFDTICEVFEDTECEYSRNDRTLTATLPVRGGIVPLNILFKVDTDNQLIQFLSPFLFSVPPGRRIEMAVLLTIINKQLLSGAFVLDFEKGSLLFRTAISYQNCIYDKSFLQNMFITDSTAVMDHIDDIYLLCFGKLSLSEYLKNHDSSSVVIP